MVGTTGSHGRHGCYPSSPFCFLSSISLSFCFLRKEFGVMNDVCMCVCVCVCVCVCSVMSYSAIPWTIACQAPLSMEFPGKNTEVGCHFLLQRIFVTQGSNPCLLHLLRWQANSLPLYHLGSPSECFSLSVLKASTFLLLSPLRLFPTPGETLERVGGFVSYLSKYGKGDASGTLTVDG